MKEIKVRAWDTKFQKMYYSHGDGDECQRVQLFHGNWEVDTMFPSGDDAGTIPCDGEHAVLMEYTGLKDKNGKEIYEGDILALDGDVVAPVTFMDGAFQLIADSSQGRSPFIQERAKRYEIIGNIYENPDLLKEVGNG